MAKLYIIDQSLTKADGEHWDYDRCIALAAQQQGFETFLATHKSFDRSFWSSHSARELDDATQVLPAFRNTAYQSVSYLADLQRHKHRRKPLVTGQFLPNGLFGQLCRSAAGWINGRRRQWLSQQFADDCNRLFENVEFKTTDHIFLARISELELIGLPWFLTRHSTARAASWHIQFPLRLFDGKPEQYSQQKSVTSLVADCVRQALEMLCYYQTNFYSTSDSLVDQYNRLGCVQVSQLPYPIAEAFRDARPSLALVDEQLGNETAVTHGMPQRRQANQRSIANDSVDAKATGHRNELRAFGSESLGVDELVTDFNKQPLRLICPVAGDALPNRRSSFQKVIDGLALTQPVGRPLQLVIQEPKFKSWLSPGKSGAKFALPDAKRSLLVAYVANRLSLADRIAYIQSADIGLLYFCDPGNYSCPVPVMGQLLTCGIPVIVPAGSWLSDQLAEANFAYVDRTIRELPQGRVLPVDQLNWNRKNVPLPGGVVSFDQGKHSFQFDVYPEERERVMALAFAWHWPKASGVYCRIDVQQHSSSGKLIQSHCRVVGVRKRKRHVKTIFNVSSNAAKVRFTLTNAFGQSSTTIHQLSVTTCLVDNDQTIPIGVVGLAATDLDDWLDCVTEMTAHYDHYRKSAKDFSIGWNSNHDPALTVDYLVGPDQEIRRSA